ncbi:GNAT family N-acetyltransferase [Microbacterium sp. AK031]|uniref:GNAT family N-acetyltransferase n=1 Tax=Microbacterium sp. AK031 TaxID=2723076 RepID=UPI00216A14CC|nr:GNAT family N-acetyltransferase [Microbacterium sp. AK031]MCS3843952.1 hypothetical protein [Microbacterium sp. AK031]
MSIDVRPATVFDDVAVLLGPKKPTSNVCFCLSYRIGSKENVALRGPDRAERVRELRAHDPAPGVIAYLGDEPVGWAARASGAPAVEGYPVDNHGEKVNQTMMYVGTKALFEGAGFSQAAETGSVLDGFPRVLMRLDL